ncbi:uncharacterized protein LOC130675920 [Microplitis mediator]|uniref:uncharacterized protein LOC130675920 n=1 Tax=Microplitis mediator TaxID=375433 RepID=UPI0025521E61|nr:uncharacterized protein LOC130675920 [Microplitis mediator]
MSSENYSFYLPNLIRRFFNFFISQQVSSVDEVEKYSENSEKLQEKITNFNFLTCVQIVRQWYPKLVTKIFNTYYYYHGKIFFESVNKKYTVTNIYESNRQINLQKYNNILSFERYTEDRGAEKKIQDIIYNFSHFPQTDETNLREVDSKIYYSLLSKIKLEPKEIEHRLDKLEQTQISHYTNQRYCFTVIQISLENHKIFWNSTLEIRPLLKIPIDRSKNSGTTEICIDQNFVTRKISNSVVMSEKYIIKNKLEQENKFLNPWIPAEIIFKNLNSFESGAKIINDQNSDSEASDTDDMNENLDERIINITKKLINWENRAYAYAKLKGKSWTILATQETNFDLWFSDTESDSSLEF